MANSIIENCGVTHIALNASDFERSLRFYTEALGFTVYRRWGKPEERMIALLDTGDGSYIELFSNGVPSGEVDTKQAGAFAHLAFHVKDTDAAYERAMAYGAESHIAPKYATLASEPPIHVRLAFVKGPDGEQLEFFQVLDD